MLSRKIYFLPLDSSCLEKCSYCDCAGFLSEEKKSSIDFKRRLKKALAGNYQAVLLPCNLVFNPLVEGLIDEILQNQLIPILQINSKSLNPTTLNFLKVVSEKGCVINVLIHDHLERTINSVLDYEKHNIPGFYSLPLVKSLDLFSLLKNLPNTIINKLELYLPHKKNYFDDPLSCYQIYRLIKKAKLEFPEFNPKPIAGLDQFDPRISKDLELEPMFYPELVNKREDWCEENLKISVIIPTYNNEAYIQNSIRHISKQNFPSNMYELILVNDGSSDLTASKIQEVFHNYKDLNFKYIYLPRPRKRKMGDAQFRAGIARNLGVKWAKGRYLSFLDADMIVPENYLEKLFQELKTSDIVQAKRYYLKSSVSTNTTDYDQIALDKDDFIPEDGYWHEFYSNNLPWNEISCGWKYVCTYGLTLSRELFCSIGWFRKTYMFYGFEDTDLGYRLFKKNKTFQLSSLKVYHLSQHDSRSEYSNSDALRQSLLSKTAKIFYRNYLDEEIYEHLKLLVSDGPTLEDLWNYAKWKR